MTLICAYKNKQSSFIISDFRVTKGKEKQNYDKTIKYLSYENKVGIFLAGDVQFWKNANNKIKKSIDNISYENILEIDKPFWQELAYEAINYNGNASGGIGFVLNQDSHKLFRIDIFPRNGAKLSLIQDNKCSVIGSGSSIPDIEKTLESIYDDEFNYCNGDAYGIASRFRYKITEEMKKIGCSSFKKLGISPVMSIAVLENDYFKICGEEGEGGNYSSNNIFEYKYQFTKNNNDELILENINEGSSVKIFNINDSNYEDVEIVFDPAKISDEFDPSIAFPDKDYIYMLEQSLFPGIRNTNFKNNVFRCIVRIEFFTTHRFCQSKEVYRNVKENIEIEEFKKYMISDKIYFALDIDKDTLFTNELDADKLFDHNWLNQFVPGYLNTLFKNT